LAELPETLDETYARTLREMNKANWELAHRLLQFVAVAFRPLRVEELAELLAFDFEDHPIPAFHEDLRMEDPLDAVLSTCSSLLAIVNVEGSPVIQFSHFSVKEFLTSTRLAEATDEISRRYHVSMTPAHTLAAQACLGILLYLDENITRHSLRKFPLAKYAAKYWVDHARFENVSQGIEDGMKQLFDSRKPHLAIWVWIVDPSHGWGQPEQTEIPPPPKLTALHYAAVCGLHSVVKFLIIENPKDVHSWDLDNDATALLLASGRGHAEVVRLLVEQGADTMACNQMRETPLHLASQAGYVEVASIIVEHGANKTARDWMRQTPLHLASEGGLVEVARVLIEHGADAIARDSEGQTALHLASKWNHAEVACMLVEHGADATAPRQNNDGQTALHLALEMGSVEVAGMLVKNGADLTTQDKYGGTALHVASRRGDVEIARMLVEQGADVTTQNMYGWTPLHLGLTWGRVEVSRMLIERGAEGTFSCQDKEGRTPLHLASDRGQVEIARMLIERNADATAQDEGGKTPLHLAIARGQWTSHACSSSTV
jgi:ankyrin repeat protein